MRKTLIYVLIIVAGTAVVFTMLSSSLGGPRDVPINQVISMSTRGEVETIEVKGDTLTVTTVSGETLTSRKESGASVVEMLREQGLDPLNTRPLVIVKGSGGLASLFGVLINFLPLILFGGILLFMMRQAQGNSSQTFSFGRSKARMFMGNSPQVSFSDVAGVEEAKEELQEVVEFLKYPERFLALGAKIPKGVLLVGPPGTGKTLMARAVAGEAGVPFFNISGSEFVEMFVGVGASRVRDLFDQAKRNSPCIVFVDEIDAVGRHRGAGLGGGHDEREQTLNQILVEMDGFDTGTNVIVIAATNRPDITGSCVVASGSFPTAGSCWTSRPEGSSADTGRSHTGQAVGRRREPGAGGASDGGIQRADLANLVNESAILAARRMKKLIGIAEFAEAIDRIVVGPARRSRVISEREKAMTAYHEAGHALVAHMLPNADPVAKVTIVARGQAGGFTKTVPEEDRSLVTRNQLEARLAMAMEAGPPRGLCSTR